MDDNCVALLMSIFRGLTPEQAFWVLKKPDIKKNSLGRIYTVQDVEDMIELRHFFSYREIAEMYNISYNAVVGKIRRWRDNHENSTLS